MLFIYLQSIQKFELSFRRSLNVWHSVTYMIATEVRPQHFCVAICTPLVSVSDAM